jgi:hypothetical protein
MFPNTTIETRRLLGLGLVLTRGAGRAGHGPYDCVEFPHGTRSATHILLLSMKGASGARITQHFAHPKSVITEFGCGLIPAPAHEIDLARDVRDEAWGAAT